MGTFTPTTLTRVMDVFIERDLRESCVEVVTANQIAYRKLWTTIATIAGSLVVGGVTLAYFGCKTIKE